jgi:hypothetical protein
MTQALETQLIRQYDGPDVGHGTHLTVYWSCSVKADHVENYGQKGGQTRNRVNLERILGYGCQGGDRKNRLQTHIAHR